MRPYLQRGELVNVLPELNFKAWQLYIFRPHQPLLPARTRLVFDLLTQILKDLFRESKYDGSSALIHHQTHRRRQHRQRPFYIPSDSALLINMTKLLFLLFSAPEEFSGAGTGLVFLRQFSGN